MLKWAPEGISNVPSARTDGATMMASRTQGQRVRNKRPEFMPLVPQSLRHRPPFAAPHLPATTAPPSSPLTTSYSFSDSCFPFSSPFSFLFSFLPPPPPLLSFFFSSSPPPPPFPTPPPPLPPRLFF